MQHVVVAIDLTPASDAAVERAAATSRAMGANLRLLHMLPELMPPVLGHRRTRKAERALRYRMQGLRRGSGMPVSCNVAHGDTPRGIVRESENLDAVLTVFGHRADGNGIRRLIGAVPERSLRLIRNAVLVVRDRSPVHAEYEKVLLAPEDGVDMSAMMPHLRHLAPRAALHRIELGRSARGRRAGRKAAEHVRAMRRALDADLLVIGMPRDDGMNPFRFRRLLTPLVREPECDTLIVPQDCAAVPSALPEPAWLRVAS